MAAESDSPRSKKPRRECDYEERFEITTQLDKSDTESRDSNTSCSTNTEIVPISGGSTSSSPTLTHSDSHGQSSSTDHSVLSQSTLPEKLSNWTRKHIEDLNIKTAYQPDTTPFTLITRPVPCTGEIGIRVLTYDVEGIKNREKEKKKKVSILADFVKRSGFLDMIQNLNCSSFEELNIDSMLKLNSYKDSCFLPKGLPENLEAWFRRFDTFGKMFIYVLSRMVENVIQRIPNTEFQFQHLFDTMVKMFGMQSGINFEPCLPIQTLEIGNVEVKGAPDIIYAHHRINQSEKKLEKPCIVAVCEVKKNKPLPSPMNTESPPSSKTRKKTAEIDQAEVSSTSKQEHNQSITQLSENLIGQHCGELLFKYSQSIGHSSIFGIVVQQTQLVAVFLIQR
ncbi:uncharacterized protein [Magallana gigas]|uniref:uncharacterized protein isoform X2 n=1 Tax=Magallana gigas TaxID=29159 RepID=UPI0033425692